MSQVHKAHEPFAGGRVHTICSCEQGAIDRYSHSASIEMIPDYWAGGSRELLASSAYLSAAARGRAGARHGGGDMYLVYLRTRKRYLQRDARPTFIIPAILTHTAYRLRAEMTRAGMTKSKDIQTDCSWSGSRLADRLECDQTWPGLHQVPSRCRWRSCWSSGIRRADGGPAAAAPNTRTLRLGSGPLTVLPSFLPFNGARMFQTHDTLLAQLGPPPSPACRQIHM